MFDLASQLAARREAGLYRSRLTSTTPQGVRVVIDGVEYLSFCSNDYLGLAAHPELVAAMCDAAGRWGAGSGASHLLGGHSEPHEALEQKAASLFNADRALLFSTGYMANLAVMTATVGRGDVIHQDRLNHASLIDGAMLSRATLKRFRHVNMDELEKHLQQGDGAAGHRQIIASDGVFSMDGDLAPLAEMLSLAKLYTCPCYIDDAHGFGVLGENGRGTVEAAGASGDDFAGGYLLLMCTLGKAVGSFGAVVVGNDEWIDTLIQNGRSYIYTTALPPAVAQTSLVSLELIEREPWRRQKLAALVSHFRAGCRQRNIRLIDSDTPIQPVVIGDNDLAVRIAEIMRKQHFLVFAIRSPTVPAGTERLRITLSAAHEESEIDQMLDALANAMDDLGMAR
jgi:8-amino-7-oxononanoate synthase